MQATGYICDVCRKFEPIEGATPPDGWIEVVPYATVPVASNNSQVNGREVKARSKLHVCGDWCMAILAVERCEANGRPVNRIPKRTTDPDAPKRPSGTNKRRSKASTQ